MAHYKTQNPFHKARAAILCALALIMFPYTAQASEQLFTINNVKVDVKGENALKAREKAFEQAQGKAFDELATRMLSERAIQSYTTPPLSTISLMVQDYEVSNEKLAASRYSGTYQIRFNDKSVRQFFNQSESASNPYANANTNVSIGSDAYRGEVTHDDAYKIPTTTQHNAQSVTSQPTNQPTSAIQVSARFASLAQWAQTQRSLANVRSISDISINSLSSKEALLTVAFNGSLSNLQAALKQAGLTLGQPRVNAANQNVYGLVHQKYAQRNPAPPRQMPQATQTRNTPVTILNNSPQSAQTRAPRANGNWANKNEPYQQKF